MKNSIKYLLLAAIAGFFFLNISGKEDKKQEQPAQTQLKKMPKIPNEDFEDRHNKAWTSKIITTNVDQDPWPGAREPEEENYIISLDSVNVHKGKYCAILTLTPGDNELWIMLENKFPVSVHPLHFACVCKMHSWQPIG